MKHAILVVVTLLFGDYFLPAAQIDPGPTLGVWEARRAYLWRPDWTLIDVRDRDFAAIETAAARGLELCRNSSMAWSQYFERNKDHEPVKAPAPLLALVAQMLVDAVLSSPTSTKQVEWARATIGFVVDVLDSPQMEAGLREMWSGVKLPADGFAGPAGRYALCFWPDAMRASREAVKDREQFRKASTRAQRQLFDYPHIASTLTGALLQARSILRRNGALAVNDWGVFAGTEWFHGPEQVRFEKGVVYIRVDCLRKLGIPVTASAAGLSITNGLTTARVRIAARHSSTAPVAFRGAFGSTWLPVEDLKRLGLYEVRIDRSSQTVSIEASVPERDDREHPKPGANLEKP